MKLRKRMLELYRTGRHEDRRLMAAGRGVCLGCARICPDSRGGGGHTDHAANGGPGTPQTMRRVSPDMMREDAPAMFIDQFQIDNRHYILLTDDLREDYGLPATVDESDIGEKITDIGSSPDKSLTGRGVYRYVPAGCEAVVAVRKDEGYQLYRFFTFESYNNNQDEEAIEYPKLYGINSAEDIARIRFIGHSERSKELASLISGAR